MEDWIGGCPYWRGTAPCALRSAPSPRADEHFTAEAAAARASAGQQRTLFLAAANRDPDVFGSPDRVDLTRTPNPHLAFSSGGHFCLGAPLARMQSEIALPALFRRRPGLRLAGPPVRIAAGADADVLVIRGNPFADIGSVTHVKAVFRAGVKVR